MSQLGHSPGSTGLSKGKAVIGLLAVLEAEGFPTVYLRNHENLPDEVGNDVDLLVKAGTRSSFSTALTRLAAPLGWRRIGHGNFSPLAIYLGNPETGETLHLDLFDRLEWHALEFANPAGVFSRRVWNGQVHVPDPADECYLNLVTRLLYQGQIRTKHQVQANALVEQGGTKVLGKAFENHLAKAGRDLFTTLAAQGWKPGSSERKSTIQAAFINYGLKRPRRLLTGIGRYFLRSVKKFLRPPGRFIVFEGTDGVCKSTILEAIVPGAPSGAAAARHTASTGNLPASLRSNLLTESPLTHEAERHAPAS